MWTETDLRTDSLLPFSDPFFDQRLLVGQTVTYSQNTHGQMHT